ncbi:MAG: phenylalanine--tRNA ligase subunit beta [Flavobacteriales bacterium]|nr:phenylalanine--tRNA ligase subunit beta [Flavobacteriales bacterium]
MRISWDWLRDLIDTDLDVTAAADLLTSTGLEVERVDVVEAVPGMLEGVVVGHVMECAKHPDADRLSVTRVDVGQGGPLQIVCGAPNVAAGQKVLVALVGSTLHLRDGSTITIKKSKIRGVESHGMICAEDELGLGEGHDGILVLGAEAVPGTPAAQQLGLRRDAVLEIGLTPNRADAMSHLGVARDLAAAVTHRTGRRAALRMPDASAFRDGAGDGAVTVEVRDAHACPRYAGVTLTGVRVGPSPDRLAERLKAIGLRPINNVVDITNYVQHELGQPLHAFDADRIRDRHVIVGPLPDGTPFTTLDGVERTLGAEDLMIADTEGGLCIAGVFGGLHSGVTEATTTVFLESACFDAVSVRRTARRHGLRTDASFRFERGVDPAMTVHALQRAALLMMEHCGARPVGPLIDLYPHPKPWRQVRLHAAAVRDLAGIALSVEELEALLALLDCRIIERSDRSLLVEVPPYRVDVHREADLVEEVLRIHGFDRVPIPERLSVPPAAQHGHRAEEPAQAVVDHLAARGFREVMTPSLVNGAMLERLGAAGADVLIRLLNPLSAELDTMRPSMLPGLLGAAAHNIARQQRDLRLFEQGRVYHRAGERRSEPARIGLLITGRNVRERWRQRPRAVEMADLKAELELLVERAHPTARLQVKPLEHPLLQDAFALAGPTGQLAVAGTVRPEVAKAHDVDQAVLFAELCDALWTLPASPVQFAEVPRFPAVRRDLSLVLDHATTFEDLRRAAHQAERKLLRDVDLFDVYEGDKLPPGTKSYAVRFTLLDLERTLTDEQVDKAMKRIREALEREAGAKVRG